MNLQKNLRLIDAYTFGTNALFVLPIWILYYRDEIGIGFREFLISEGAFAATIVLLDVPTGWISDIWLRKHVQALGIFVEMIGFACLLMAKSFAMTVVAQIILGAGISLCSGTNTALLYDSLLFAAREDEYRRREGRRQAIGFYTTAATSVLGGFIYTLNHKLPLVLCILALLGAFIASCLLDEPPRHKRPPERHPLADIIATIKYALHGHAEIGFIILFSAALFCCSKMLMWSQQPYYMALGVPESWYGLLVSTGFLLGGVSSHAAHLLDGKVSPYRALAALWAFELIVCLGAGLHASWYGVVLLMLGGTCTFGLASPRVNEVINRSVDSSRRATVLSTQNLMVQGFFIPLSIALGSVSNHWGIEAVMLWLAGWLCFAGACLALFAFRRKRASQP